MKFTLSWLNDHLATKATLDDILALMLKAGLEVEEVEDPRDKLSAFSVCKVKAAEPHPDADKLRVCTVDTVDGEKQIGLRGTECPRRHDGDLCTAGRLYSGPRICPGQEAAQDSRY